MSYIDTIKELILKPKEFFRKIGKEKGIKRAFLIYFWYLLISNLIDILTTPKSYLLELVPISQSFKVLFLILGYVISVLLGLIVTFILVGVDYLFLRLLKGKGTFENTFNAYVFSFIPFFIAAILLSIPTFFLGTFSGMHFGATQLASNPIFITLLIVYFIMIVGVLIYCFYWYIYSLSLVNKISRLRAFVAVVVLPVAITIMFMLLLFFFGLFFMRKMFGI